MIDDEFKDLKWEWTQEDEKKYVSRLEQQLKDTKEKLRQALDAKDKPANGHARGRLQGSHKKIITSVRLPPDIYAWMIRQDISQAILIEKAMRAHYNIPKP